LVLPFTVIFAYALLGQPSSKLVLSASFVVFCGFYTGVTSEINVSKRGVFFGIVSSITTSLHAIVIKKSLVAVNNSSIDLVYYNNFLSMLATTPIVFLSGEISTVIEIWSTEGFQAFHSFLAAALVTGFFGFLVNLAGFMQISKTSPTTHMISGAVRGVLQTLLGYFAFHDDITTGRLAGIILILGGGALYTYAKDQEMQAKSKPTYIPMTQQDMDGEDDERNQVGKA
jgi:GDP-fucose transporter C1